MLPRHGPQPVHIMVFSMQPQADSSPCCPFVWAGQWLIATSHKRPEALLNLLHLYPRT